MAKITKEVEVLKEISEIGDLFIEIAKTIKDKGDYAALLPHLVKAIEGVGDIAEEIKDTEALVNTGFFIAGGLTNVFIKKDEPTE